VAGLRAELTQMRRGMDSLQATNEVLREQIEDLETTVESMQLELAEIKQQIQSKPQTQAAAIDAPTSGPHVSLSIFLASIGLGDVCSECDVASHASAHNTHQFARPIVNYGALTVGMLLLLSVKDLEGHSHVGCDLSVTSRGSHCSTAR